MNDEGGTSFVVGVREVGVEDGVGVAQFVFEDLPFDCAPVGFPQGDNPIAHNKLSGGLLLGAVIPLPVFVGAEKPVSVPGADAKLVKVAWENAVVRSWGLWWGIGGVL